MSTASLIGKMAVIALLIKLSSGAFEDVATGIMNGVSVNSARSEMKQLHNKLLEYYTMHQHYPKTLPILVHFFQQEFDTPVEQVMTDPWQKSYYFLTKKVEIQCCGPDTVRYTGDDLETPYPSNVRFP